MRQRKREMREARKRCRKAIGLPERKPQAIARSLSLKEKIKLAVKKGCKTREEIYEEVRQGGRLNRDEFGDALAELAFDSGEVRRIGHGDERIWHLAA